MSVYENFDEQKQFACRVIADHARSTAFAIADGILPGNEGRNYVLRKIMRRAIYHGREHLDFDGLFFNKVCDFVVGEMKDAYPELEIQRDFIGKMVRLEEERFGNTMTVGLKKLNELLAKSDFDLDSEELKNPFAKLPGTVQLGGLAKLYDTFGLPIDLMYVVLKSKYPTRPDYDPLDKFSFWTLERNVGSEYTGTKERFSVVETLGYFADKTDESNESYEVLPYNSIKFINEEQFRVLIEEELKIIQANSEIGKTKQADKINPIYVALERTSVKSNFHGYDKTEVEGAKVLALVKNEQKVDVLDEGDEGLIVLDETPFYAESGGQVGDAGMLVSTVRVSGRSDGGNQSLENTNGQPPANAGGTDTQADKSTDTTGKSADKSTHTTQTTDKSAAIFVKVLDTFAPIAGIVLHKSKIEKGSIRVGDVVTATVDAAKRDATRRNHTATHLVHAALKEVLGTHVKQAGSVVAPNYLRFDFTHYQPISEAELTEIEDLVNREILKNDPVSTDLMSIEDAMRSGAMALFGEKYGSTVRVLSVGGGEFSKELCGGTHVRATGDIGSFKIMSDEAVASGVRRIRAITGIDAFERFREDEKLIAEAVQIAKAQRDNLPSAIEKLQEELKKARRENDELKMKIATGAIGGASSNGDEAKDINGVKVIAKTVDGLDKGGMRHLSDTLMAKIKSGVVIVAKAEDAKFRSSSASPTT